MAEGPILRSDGSSEGTSSHNGDSTVYCDGDLSDVNGSDSSSTTRFPILEEGKAFLEATFDSHLNYKNRKAQITEYSEPDCKWMACPMISPVVAATLPNNTIKEDKLAFWTMVALLTVLLESTDDESFTIKDAIQMV